MYGSIKNVYKKNKLTITYIRAINIFVTRFPFSRNIFLVLYIISANSITNTRMRFQFKANPKMSLQEYIIFYYPNFSTRKREDIIDINILKKK